MAVFVFIRLHFCQELNINGPSSCLSLGPLTSSLNHVQSAKGKQDCQERAGAALRSRPSRVTDVVVTFQEFFHRVIKLYRVCIKWFRQEIHLCSAQHLTSQPPPFLSLYTYTFLWLWALLCAKCMLLYLLKQFLSLFLCSFTSILQTSAFTHML